MHHKSPHRDRCRRLAMPFLLAGTLAAAPAAAQVTLKPDGKWRHLLTAGLNLNSGNTKTSALNLASESVRATDSSKWSASAQALYTSSGGATTGERLFVSSQYNADLSQRTFAFTQASGLRDRPANIRDRLATTTGLGWHLMRRQDEFWDVWAGLAASTERYVNPVLIDGETRDRFNDAGLVLAQESGLVLGANTKFRQKLVLLPSLRESGHLRAEFDAQVVVAMNARLNLSTGLSMRHNSDPGPGLKKLDTALVTGLSLRFD